jgi:hypothetical protein
VSHAKENYSGLTVVVRQVQQHSHVDLRPQTGSL